MSASSGQLAQALIQLLVTGLVVRGVGHDSRGSLDPESEAALGMVQPPRGHFVIANREAFSTAQFAEFPRALMAEKSTGK